jgi:hypothetical protein
MIYPYFWWLLLASASNVKLPFPKAERTKKVHGDPAF